MSGTKALKVFLVFLVVALAVSGLAMWYETVMGGNYTASAGMFLSIMAWAAPVVILVGAAMIIRYIAKFDFSTL